MKPTNYYLTLTLTLFGGLILGMVLSFLFGAISGNSNKPAENVVNSLSSDRYNNEYYSLNDSDPIYRALIDDVSLENLKKTVRFLAKEPHMAGTKRDTELADYYVNEFTKAGMDRVLKLPYRVLLSYPDEERGNSVYIMDKNSRKIVHTVKAKESLLRPEDKYSTAAYNAYSPKADVSGSIVYANYGSEKDFDELIEARIEIKGQICLIRLGRMHRGNKLDNAAKAGCAGVLFFSDPSKIAPFKPITPEKVYPNSVYMNGEAMQRGNTRFLKGDPLTPGYPALNDDGVYRFHVNDPAVRMPAIPSQPIGYNDARIIFENMDGPDVERIEMFRSWKGALNCTYRLTAENDRIVRMVTNNKLETRTIYNVIAILDGELEPDRFVIVGNHRDSYGVGAMDAVTGSAPMLESARIFGQLKKNKGWRPRRSIVFASWSAEEHGLIGSFEFVEEHLKLLQSNTLAYINIDTCVKGPDVDVEAWPSLQNVCRETFKRVPAHKRHSNETPTATSTIHDNWVKQLQEEKRTTLNDTVMPVKLLGSGSDHAPFAFYANIPSIDFTFKPVNGTLGASYPAYHTAYETLHLLEKFVDPQYEIHRSCSRVISMFLYQLSSTTLFGTDFRELSQMVTKMYKQNNLTESINTSVSPNEPTAALKLLESSMSAFANQSVWWHLFVEKVKTNKTLLNDPYRVRFINDVSNQVHQVFSVDVSQNGQWKSQLKNILFSPPASNSYSVVLFPAIVDSIEELKRIEIIKRESGNYEQIDELTVKQDKLKLDILLQLNKLTFAFNAASKLLRERQL